MSRILGGWGLRVEGLGFKGLEAQGLGFQEFRI